MSRVLYPNRDTVRVMLGIAAAKWIGALVIVAAFYLAPDVIVSWMMGGL